MSEPSPGPSSSVDLFDTFTSQEVLAAPASEMEDPLTLEDIRDFLTSEIQVKEEPPVIQNTFQLSAEEYSSVGVKIESELICETLPCDADGAPVLPPAPPPGGAGAGAGLRIAGFAVDPDSLCVLPSQSSSTTSQHQDHLYTAPTQQQSFATQDHGYHATTASSTLQVQTTGTYNVQQQNQYTPNITWSNMQGNSSENMTQSMTHPSQSNQMILPKMQIQPTQQPLIYSTASPNVTIGPEHSARGIQNDSGTQTSALCFPLAALQEEKIYSIWTITSGVKSFKKYHIYTATPVSKNGTAGTENKYKLFIPFNYHTMKERIKTSSNIKFSKLFLQAGPSDGIRQESLVVHFPNGTTARCEAPKSLEGFGQSVAQGSNILTWQSSIDRFVQQFHGQWNTRLFPSFSYEKSSEFQKIEMHTKCHMLGFEGTPLHPTDPNRQKQFVTLYRQICGVWFQDQNSQDYNSGSMPPLGANSGPKDRIANLAALIEDEVFQEATKVTNFLHSPQHLQVVLKVKDCFLTKRTDYPSLRNYPDIMYQVMVSQGVVGLRTSFNSLSVVTKSTALMNLLNQPTATQAVNTYTPSQPTPSVDMSIVDLEKLQADQRSSSSSTVRAQTVIVQNSDSSNAPNPILNSMLVQQPRPITGLALFFASEMRGLSLSPRQRKESVQLTKIKWENLVPELRNKYNLEAQRRNNKSTMAGPTTSGSVQTRPSSSIKTPLNCPFYPNDCAVSNTYQDVSNFLRHLNAAHFSIQLELHLSSLQKQRGLPPYTCPVQPCGFIGPSKGDLVWHFSRCSATTARLLKDSAERLQLPRYAAMAKLPALQPFPVQVTAPG